MVGCPHVARVKRKTIAVDPDVYRMIERRQRPGESLSRTLRRLLEQRQDPADYPDEVFREFVGTGVMSDQGLARVRRRRKEASRPCRPATGRDLAKRWPHLPHLSPAEAAAFERELASARRRLPAGKSAPR